MKLISLGLVIFLSVGLNAAHAETLNCVVKKSGLPAAQGKIDLRAGWGKGRSGKTLIAGLDIRVSVSTRKEPKNAVGVFGPIFCGPFDRKCHRGFEKDMEDVTRGSIFVNAENPSRASVYSDEENGNRDLNEGLFYRGKFQANGDRQRDVTVSCSL